ncbi:MAG: hypothetical protein OMM_04605 [Candidatus Magnetoglobus multicellularis str. Araruama]|uniref:Uncharacterized protein n=1 Tax=Candidatus Magnetoglobus multicellularis str. Araruama TaxID=890399 RepID=A0A1V1P0J5_9BACT|nr:MAG: hypothetical protein OMM_04605 [Candidatus Magnetoglobus multicellularis str. Araruama]
MFLIFWIPTSNADDHHEKRGKHHYDKTNTHRYDKSFSSNERHEKDKGNETTGLIAAFIFVAANITVILSILIRALNRSSQISNIRKDQFRKINKIQKKYLSPVHYTLNPIALFFGLTHFFLSYCRSSSLPEWGLGGMAILVVMGLLIKLKMLPQKIRKSVYQFHANPLPLCILMIILFIGHGIID